MATEGKEIFVKMRPFLICSGICMMLVVGARAGAAQQVRPFEPEWLRQMHGKGWEKVQVGVLRRDTGGRKYETFSYGAEGLQWVAQGYEQQLSFFEAKYRAFPSPKLARTIERVREEIARLYGEIAAAPPAGSFRGEALFSCSDPDFLMRMPASAGPREIPRGVWAEASANFRSSCYIGDTFAIAHAEATDANDVHTVETQEDPSTGATASSYAYASASGIKNCYSWAQASVSYGGATYLGPRAENYVCPPDVKVTITGTDVVNTDYYSNACVDLTWTASAIRGTPGYTYKWYIGTVLQSATGTTLTKRFCNTGGPVTAKVVATDTRGWTDDAAFTSDIQYKGPIVAGISGPASVTTNSATPCADVTWTASATSSGGGHVGGGHSGFTYSWYLGSGTTVQGTGTTFTKRYCNTTTSVQVKVVARASDGHTDDVVRTTTITHEPDPPAASISGPAIVQISTFGECVNITWTAGATGGAPGYTYTWYIGTSTTVQGTGSTLTKTFCGAQTINVKVTARDSAAQADDALFTTTVERAPYNECGTNQICP